MTISSINQITNPINCKTHSSHNMSIQNTYCNYSSCRQQIGTMNQGKYFLRAVEMEHYNVCTCILYLHHKIDCSYRSSPIHPIHHELKHCIYNYKNYPIDVFHGAFLVQISYTFVTTLILNDLPGQSFSSLLSPQSSNPSHFKPELEARHLCPLLHANWEEPHVPTKNLFVLS